MENSHFLILLFVIVAVVLILYFQLSAKRDQLTFVNQGGSRATVNVEVADTALKKMRGLMFRESLPENDGMLFIFPRQGIYPFWMVNTSIPLDAIFISEDGRVVEVISMEPCGVLNCPTYTPKQQARYVLEVNKGYAEGHGIRPGATRVESLSIASN